LIQALVGTHQEFLAELLDPALAQHFKNVEDDGESMPSMEVDSVPIPDTGKSVAAKVLEIRMFFFEIAFELHVLALHITGCAVAPALC